MFKLNLQFHANDNTITYREDIARAMYAEAKEVFMKNLKKQPTEQWKSYATVKDSTKNQEKYDSVGNLKPADVKAEGASIVYGDIKEAYVTTVVNETIANGFKVTMEAQEDEQWGVIPEVKVSELARTMIAKRELAVAAVWDGVTTAVGADGVPYASNIHPLVNDATKRNDNLIEDTFDIDSYQDGVKRFNHWYNHYGDKFFTTPSAMLAHRDRQTEIFAMLQSTLLPFESSITNTKNTIPQLKTIFSSYIAALPVHILDESIDTAIFQRRKGLKDGYDYDVRDTFNFFYNIHERYKAAMINPGFGFATITGVTTPVLVKVATGSVAGATAGDSKITGLDAAKAYTIKFGGTTFPVLAGGIVSTDVTDDPVVLGVGKTEILGLVNGVTYLVTEVE